MRPIRDILKTDPKRESVIVQEFLSAHTKGTPKRDGIIVGVSGGIDSAVVAALAVAAVGKDKVFGMILPEKDSNPDSAKFARLVINNLGIRHETMDLTDAVGSFGAYRTRDEVIRSIFPEYDESYKFNIRLPQNLLEVDRYNFYTLRIDNGKGDTRETRLAKSQFLAITAAANVKIRSRMIALYFLGEQMNYMVAGTTNKTEFLLGDFCKYGDGGTDVECVSHLYKTQIYQLGEFFGTPKEIMDRTPSPDTFSLAVSDKDFYFCLPFDILDPLLYAWEYKLDTDAVAGELGLEPEQIERAYRDFDSKHSTTEHIRRLPPAIERDWREYAG
jgi:NAD+ synthase